MASIPYKVFPIFFDVRIGHIGLDDVIGVFRGTRIEEGHLVTLSKRGEDLLGNFPGCPWLMHSVSPWLDPSRPLWMQRLYEGWVDAAIRYEY
jgi:hypothetical protein